MLFPMLRMVMVAVLVFAVLYVAVEIGDRHGFSPLSKIAQAFDVRPARPSVPLSSVDPTLNVGGSAPGSAEGLVS